MVRHSLVILIVLGVLGPASAQNPPSQPGSPARDEAGGPEGLPPELPPLPLHLQNAPTPRSPSPGIALASANAGRIYLRSVLPFPKPAAAPNATGAGAPAPNAAAGAARGELASIAEAFDARRVQARTAAGQAVGAEDLARRLATETPVLVGFASLPIDPTYLRLARGDTLILLLPEPPVPQQIAPPIDTPAAPTGSPAPPRRP